MSKLQENEEQVGGTLAWNTMCGILINTMTREEALKLVQEDAWNLQDLPEEFKKDKEIVLAAVQQDSYALRFADDSLKNDLAFVKKDK